MDRLVLRAGIIGASMLVGFGALAQLGGRLDVWSRGYQMGAAWAGVATSDGGIRLRIFCGDKEAAAANRAIKAGPSLQVAMSKITPPRKTKSIRLVVDRKTTDLPVAIERVPDAVNFDWKPSRAFDAGRMSRLLTELRDAQALRLEIAGAMREVSLKNIREALSEDIIACR
ncbi:hypothetical protein ACXIUS_09870 [Bosea thiooxidans]|nr:hypothetical protein [Bosea sp. (in: a-proteobacteria)]